MSGQVKVGNRNNVLTAGQSLEYLNGICVIRMAEMMIGAIGIVPGACSAWRRSALEEIGGFSEDTLAEDADAAMTLQRLRYAVLHENHAICDTEAPETIVPLLKQRKRWMFGNFQVLWKNRSMLLRPRYGMLGMVTMPYSVAQLLLNFLFLPILVDRVGSVWRRGIGNRSHSRGHRLRSCTWSARSPPSRSPGRSSGTAGVAGLPTDLRTDAGLPALRMPPTASSRVPSSPGTSWSAATASSRRRKGSP